MTELELYLLSMVDLCTNILIDTVNQKGKPNRNPEYKSRVRGYKITLKTKLIDIDESIDSVLNFKSMY